MIELTIDPHPKLDTAVFVAEFTQPMGEVPTPESVLAGLKADAAVPMQRDEETRKAARDLLRHGGHKPTGRGKPASEYLVRAAESGDLGSINLAVDILNLVSLHSGLPISVVDLDRATPPFRIGIAEDESYVFNASGQEISLRGLLCLYDAAGPCANAVKDCQRTKTHERSTRTLSVIWGTSDRAGRTEEAYQWYRSLLLEHGATVDRLDV